MKILHTSDWHVGKRLGRHDRSADTRAAIAEVAAIAAAEEVDLVVHAGDLFDRALPPIDALEIAFEGLVDLTGGGRRPVVVIAGNHDSPDLFEALAPFLRRSNVRLVGAIHRPEDGGVLDLRTPGGRAVVSCFPFLRHGRVVAPWEDLGRDHQRYAERLAALAGRYAEYAERLAAGDAVTILLAHFLVSGVTVQGHGAPRGERTLHMGEAYAASPAAIPAGPQYVAMGHIHAPQKVPGSVVPAEYAGSLLELDFGEAGEAKRVVLVEATPGLPATVRSLAVTAGRRLVRAEGTWEELAARSDLDDAYVDLTVITSGPDPELAARARERFPWLVQVRTRPVSAPERRSPEAAEVVRLPGLEEAFRVYEEQAHGAPPPDELLAVFREVLEEASR